jgi:hypothetical protein
VGSVRRTGGGGETAAGGGTTGFGMGLGRGEAGTEAVTSAARTETMRPVFGQLTVNPMSSSVTGIGKLQHVQRMKPAMVPSVLVDAGRGAACPQRERIFSMVTD